MKKLKKEIVYIIRKSHANGGIGKYNTEKH